MKNVLEHGYNPVVYKNAPCAKYKEIRIIYHIGPAAKISSPTWSVHVVVSKGYVKAER